MDYHNRQVSNFKGRQNNFHNNKESPTFLYFAGVVHKNSLIGGCGWCLVRNGLVLSYGAAPVQQAFPSEIRMEFEGLLNALQAALKRGVKYVIIKGTSPIIVSSFFDSCPSFFLDTVRHQVRGIRDAVFRTLNFLDRYTFQLIDPGENIYSVKLAKNIIADSQQYNKMGITKKLKLTSITVATPPSTAPNTTTTTPSSTHSTTHPRSGSESSLSHLNPAKHHPAVPDLFLQWARTPTYDTELTQLSPNGVAELYK